MGKRVNVAASKKPAKLNTNRLREPAQQQIKLFAVGVPLVFYIILALLLFKQEPVAGGVWIGWLVIGWVLTLGQGNSQKAKLQKTQPGSKVAGTAFQDVRLTLARQCRLLDIKPVPEAFIVQSDRPDARVRGMGGSFLVISSRLHQSLTPHEFEALLAELLGHVKAGTVFWRTFVVTLRSAPGLVRILCLPYWFIAQMMSSYLEYSQQSADAIALLLLDGDYRLLTRIIIKTIAYTSPSLSEMQVAQIDAFLAKQGAEARAEDVEQQLVLSMMTREIKGLRERLQHVSAIVADERFQEELAKVRERAERMQATRA